MVMVGHYQKNLIGFCLKMKNYFSSCRCGERKVVRTRIVGGQNAQKNEYPWQVSDGGNITCSCA